MEQGFMDSAGKHVHAMNNTVFAPTGLNADLPTIDLDKANTALTTKGTKSSLRTLKRAALVVLCTKKLPKLLDSTNAKVDLMIDRLMSWVCILMHHDS
jgi:hypothetical protein